MYKRQLMPSVPFTYNGNTGIGRPTMKNPMNTAKTSGSNCANTERTGPWAAGNAAAVETFDMKNP